MCFVTEHENVLFDNDDTRCFYIENIHYLKTKSTRQINDQDKTVCRFIFRNKCFNKKVLKEISNLFTAD